MHVYTDKKGNYRSFSDDIKCDIERCQRNLELIKKQLEKALNSNWDESASIELYRKWIANDEKRLIKLNKELSKG